MREESQTRGSQTGASMIQLMDRMSEQLRRMAERDRPSLVDTRGIGKPTVFKSEEPRFIEWSGKTEDYLIGIEPKLADMLEWSLEQETEVTIQMVREKFGDDADDLDKIEGAMQLVAQLKSLLSYLTEGEAWSIVQNCNRNGLEAWRKLHKRFDPVTGGRRRNLLRAIMAPARIKVEDIGNALQVWEKMVDRYDQRSSLKGEPRLSEDLKCSAVEGMMPEDLEKHLQLNANRLQKYEEMKEEIQRYFETHTGKSIKTSVKETMATSSGMAPMEVDALTRKGGRDKGGKGDVKCYVCGKLGHKAADCWSNKSSSGKSSNADVTCYNCGKKGHRAADCWSRPSGSAGDKGSKGKAKGKSKGGKGKAKGKGKDKGKGHGKHASGLEEAHYDHPGVESDGEAGGLELGGLHLCSVADDAQKWDQCEKFNFDTGAAATVFPKHMAGENFKGQANGRSYKTASGESIPDHGGLKLRGRDESNLLRTITGRVTDVHKPLTSASQCLGGGNQLCWLDSDGGWIIPRGGVIGKALENELQRLIQKHGSERLLPVYQEKGVYNFYLQIEGREELNAVGGSTTASSSSASGSGGFHRQEYTP